MRAPTFALLLVLPLLAACAPQEPAGDADAAPGLDALYERFSAAYRDLDLEAMADIYTGDALYLPPGGDIRRGREAVRASFATFFGWAREQDVDVEIAFHVVDRTVRGDLAVDVGYYSLATTPSEAGGGEPGRSVGKFVTVAERSADGEWRFRIDGYSPAPAEAFDPGAAPAAAPPLDDPEPSRP